MEHSEAVGSTAARQRPQTGAEFLESLRDDREVWIYGERVDDVTAHPAFRNSARSLAELYDAFDDPRHSGKLLVPTDTGSGGSTHAFFRAARSQEDLRAGRDATEVWQRLGFGWLGRTPDYKAALITGFGTNPDWFGEFADNARYWYRRTQEEVLHVGHAIVHPPVDRSKGPEQVRDVFVHVERETDAGLIISGAKVVATGSPLTQYVYVSHFGVPLDGKDFSVVFLAPTNAPGVKMFARASYEEVAARTANPMMHPLSSRLDENDAILVFDEALIPWENVLVYDPKKANELDGASRRQTRGIFQAATRLGVKLEFLAGALSKALDVTGTGSFRGVQAALGEVIGARHVVAGLRDGMIERAEPGWGDGVDPNFGYGIAYAALAPKLYSRARAIIEEVVASGLVEHAISATELDDPELAPLVERYLRGSAGSTALDRSKIMHLLWDAIGSEFGARHELYELNYFGSPEANHLGTLAIAKNDGSLDEMRGLVEECMSQYDIGGWVDDRFFTGVKA
ncbi:4-hydroxyphenylacetate 3-hydroxylase family protein [Leucobacter soli]|uniref:4-nitrophenol 2-monooxygenase, oxygenase component n=1 Tax=Leucobacter soli TaxID=2812850 RepID=A0A916JSR9_9MICO|nr:4-hydroxyphenylacetate 3-hydroxylase N-terminal domain-containing protein [Leucobacter soli]CAG7600095.1 4-nitrophenol 2-monooxygenase, oxygenase component [Leucobacter soli]